MAVMAVGMRQHVQSLHLMYIKGGLIVIHIIKEDPPYASVLLPGWQVEVLVTHGLVLRIQAWVVLVTFALPKGVKLPSILLPKVCWSEVTPTSIPSLPFDLHNPMA